MLTVEGVDLFFVNIFEAYGASVQYFYVDECFEVFHFYYFNISDKIIFNFLFFLDWLGNIETLINRIYN